MFKSGVGIGGVVLTFFGVFFVLPGGGWHNGWGGKLGDCICFACCRGMAEGWDGDGDGSLVWFRVIAVRCGWPLTGLAGWLWMERRRSVLLDLHREGRHAFAVFIICVFGVVICE